MEKEKPREKLPLLLLEKKKEGEDLGERNLAVTLRLCLHTCAIEKHVKNPRDL